MNLIENNKQKEENEKGDEPKKSVSGKHQLLNILVFIFSLVLTLAALASFFICVGLRNSTAAYSIASTYILAMLLAAPTLKTFLDKASLKKYRRLNICGIIIIFSAILVVAISSFTILAVGL